MLVREIQFFDLTNDNVDELIVWSQGRDSLFLSIIDITKPDSKHIYNSFVLSGPVPNNHKNWDISRIVAGYSDDRPGSIYFAIYSGYSHKPRGIFEFNMEEKKVVNQFLFNAAFNDFTMFDLNDDGVEELIICTTATDNFPDSVKYSDAFSWLFILNQNLDLLLSLKTGEAFSSTRFFTGPISQNPYLYVVTNKKNIQSELLKIDKNYQIIARKSLKKHVIGLLRVDGNEVCEVLLRNKDQSKKIVIAANLETIDSFDFAENAPLAETADIDNNGNPNYYYIVGTEIYFLDESLKKIAHFDFENNERLYQITLMKQPGFKNKFALNTTKNSYLVQLKPSLIYKYLWPFFLIQIFVFYGGIFLVNLIFNRIYIYFSYFRYSLKDSDNAILLINNLGRILSINHKVEETLMLESSADRKHDVFSLLQKRNEICEIIAKAIEENRQIAQGVSFSTASSTFIGNISITPFFSYFKYSNAYLIEIRDNTQQIIADRQNNWQRNVRRMVHDIKNPLAGIQLKLQMIYLRLADEAPEIADKLQDEIEIANSELRRIRNISKDFLKFSDLNDSTFEILDIGNLIEECVNHFKAFLNKHLQIQATIDSEIRTAVWDKRQIELLLHILIENAIDALNGNGKIQIAVSLVQNLINKNSDLINIKLTDNGPGINPQQMDKIFEPNFSSKPEGSGMGLIFAKQIVQRHHGKLEVTSDPDRETVFEMLLPIDASGEKNG